MVPHRIEFWLSSLGVGHQEGLGASDSIMQSDPRNVNCAVPHSVRAICQGILYFERLLGKGCRSTYMYYSSHGGTGRLTWECDSAVYDGVDL